MDDAALADDGSDRATRGPCTERERLRAAVRASRRAWRWYWQRFWILRWENSLRRPGWRVDEEDLAWRRMREEVRRYAQLRRRLSVLAAAAPRREQALIDKQSPLHA